MPQASLRSVVYRSFVTCDDPKGVVECGTIRKSKADPKKMEGKVETQRVPKNLNKSCSSSNKREKEEEMISISKGTHQEENDSSSLQIMEVSRGAQKLNQVIDSWSNGVSFDGQSKDIAKDLLKGALDLQDSLRMLGKLQEASQYMSKLKKKQKEKGRSDEFGVDRFSQNYQAGFRNPSPSANGSSRDCYEELRDVIRDSFARQNLLPNGSYEEKAYFNRRKVDSSPDLPSTSSSRSTMAYSHDFASSDCSFSSKGGPEEKPKCSNLIAKLMGLEEISSKKTFHSASQEKLEREKIVNQRKPVFDIDMRQMPKSRKPQFLVQKADRDKMTLDEIIEMMQFKGLLNGNKLQTNHYNSNSHVDKTFSADSPPIVIMKPWRPGQEVEEVPKKWKTKQEVPSIDCRGGVLNSIEVRRKTRVEETPEKKVSPEKGMGFKKAVLAKPEDKEIKIKENASSNKTKGSVPARAKLQKKETVEKKVDKIQKMAPSRRKPVEMENLISTSVSKTLEQSKQSPTKQRKSESKSNITRERVSQQKSTSPNSVSHKSSDQKKGLKNEKLVNKSLETKVEKIELKNDEMPTNVTCENESDRSVSSTTPAVPLFQTEEESYSSEILVEEICDNKHESGANSTKEANYGISDNKTERNNLLLRSPSFLTHAEELFNIYTYNSETADSRLLSDCTNEILEHESRRRIPAIHPLLQNPISRSRFCVAADKLAAEVRDGIENLRSYATMGGGGGAAGGKRVPGDTVYGVLERDLGCRGGGGVVGGWGVGWKDGFTVGEVEEVVGDIDKLVLSELIEEVIRGYCGLAF